MELTKEWVAKRLPSRPKDANKGTFGKVLIFAGSENFPGAAYLACAAAYRVGAGVVTLVTEQIVKIIVSKNLPEVTFLSSKEVDKKFLEYETVLIGPGIGQEEKAEKLVKYVIKKDLGNLLIDADGLNILSEVDNWWQKIKPNCILTPHPGEMARLTGLSVKEIQSDRLHVAQYFAKKWHTVVVLKGANTVIASPAGEVVLNSFANPILATAGTGDVLAGIISGMLAQGLDPFDASCIGVYIHGLAGETIREQIGDTGMIASDLLPTLPKVIKQLKKS